MEKPIYPIEVTMTISPREKKINDVYHIKWEENLIKIVAQQIFKFTTFDLETAMKRLNYILEVHSNEYFSCVIIDNNREFYE
jgi:hypothetical protein